jgi:hypothetical protein
MTQAYDITTYGERMAEVYDQWPGVPQNMDAIVTGLTRLAGRGPILELGIGTGGLLCRWPSAASAYTASTRPLPWSRNSVRNLGGSTSR